MNERRRPGRRGRRPSPRRQAADPNSEVSPYRSTDEGESAETTTHVEPVDTPVNEAPTAPPMSNERAPDAAPSETAPPSQDPSPGDSEASPPQSQPQYNEQRFERHGGGHHSHRQEGDYQNNRNGRRHRRHRGRGRRGTIEPQAPPAPVVPDTETTGWFDPSRDGGFVRRDRKSTRLNSSH